MLQKVPQSFTGWHKMLTKCTKFLKKNPNTTRKISLTSLIPTNIASVDLVMGCPNTKAGVKIVGEKEPLQPPNATQISTPSLTTTSGVAVGVPLVMLMLVGILFGSSYGVWIQSAFLLLCDQIRERGGGGQRGGAKENFSLFFFNPSKLQTDKKFPLFREFIFNRSAGCRSANFFPT